jgi:hypothetical protein
MISRRLILALAVALFFLRPAAVARRQTAQSPGVDAIVARASAYVAGYVGSLASVVCEERYEQHLLRVQVVDEHGSLNARDAPVTSRVLVSDYLLVHLPGTRGWLPFRDVFSVDGTPVRDREDRLTRLFLQPGAEALHQAEQIRSESSRYNIGSAVRDTNVPTFALQFLLPEVRTRFAFRLQHPTTIDGVPVQVVAYEETARPTLITGRDGEDVQARGSLWIEATAGTVVRTRLETKSGAKTARIDVTFRRDPRLGIMVPADMQERHEMLDDRLLGVASYGNYRQFRVETNEQIK